MGGLPQGEQPGPGREQPHDGGSLDGADGVLDVCSHAFDGIVEPSVETFPGNLRDIVGLMGRNLQTGERLRPVDLARGHGLSTQAVRNYEEAGILPAAGRTPHGYRTYTPLHAGALRAFLALVPGHGHRTAASVMRAVNEDAAEEAFRLIDESHAELLDDRRTLHAVENALRDLGPVPTARGRPRHHLHRAAGGQARHPARDPAQVGARRPGPPAPGPADRLPRLRRDRRAGRPAGPPAPAGRLSAGADRPADRPGAGGRRAGAAGGRTARLARPAGHTRKGDAGGGGGAGGVPPPTRMRPVPDPAAGDRVRPGPAPSSHGPSARAPAAPLRPYPGR